MREMQKKGKKGKNVSKHVKLICISNNVGAYISKHCAISLIWIALTMLFLKLFAFFNVTKFQFLVILSENLSIGFEGNCRPRAIILDNSWAKNANLWLMLNCNLFSITLSPDAALILLKNVTLYRITDHWWLDQTVKKLIAFRSRKFIACHSNPSVLNNASVLWHAKKSRMRVLMNLITKFLSIFGTALCV